MTHRTLMTRVRDRAIALSARLPTGARYCCLCGANLRRFVPYRAGWRSVPALIQVLQVVGSDVDNFGCPVCGSHDRERHLYLYLEAAGLLEQMKESTILHLAPERHLSARIAAAGPSRYVMGDLYPQAAHVEKIDLLSISYPDSTFDFVIANHVLEHVADDLRALSEICRVLRPGGRAILQTPYSPVLISTFADSGIDSEAARLHAYGQEDHVRLYGRDIFERFASVGLRPKVCRHQDLLPHVDARRYGVNVHEPLFQFQKDGVAEPSTQTRTRIGSAA